MPVTVCGLFMYLFIYNSLTAFFGPFDSVLYFWMMSQRMWYKIASAFCLDLAHLVFRVFIAKWNYTGRSWWPVLQSLDIKLLIALCFSNGYITSEFRKLSLFEVQVCLWFHLCLQTYFKNLWMSHIMPFILSPTC